MTQRHQTHEEIMLLEENEAVRAELRRLIGLLDTLGRWVADEAQAGMLTPRQADELRAIASGTPTRRAETTGSVGEADGGPTRQGDAPNPPPSQSDSQ